MTHLRAIFTCAALVGVLLFAFSSLAKADTLTTAGQDSSEMKKSTPTTTTTTILLLLSGMRVVIR